MRKGTTFLYSYIIGTSYFYSVAITYCIIIANCVIIIFSDQKEESEFKELNAMKVGTARDIEDTAAEPEYAVVGENVPSSGNIDFVQCPAYNFLH